MNKLEKLRSELLELENTKYKIEKQIENTKNAIKEAEQGEKEVKPYDLVYIIKSDSTAKEISNVENNIKNIVTDRNSRKENVKQYEHLGIRRLAYEVKGHKDGYYVTARLKMTNQDLILVEKELRKAECVLKFITVSISEEDWEE